MSLYRERYTIQEGAPVNAVKVSPDGAVFATCCSNGLVRVHSIEDGSLLVTLAGHTRGVSDIAFSPTNSNILASALDDMSIRIWALDTGRCLHTLTKHTFHVTTLAFASRGNILISGSADETLVVWDLSSGRSLKTLAAHLDPVSLVCLTPDDSVIVSGSYDGLMRLFDLETGQCLKTLVCSSSHGTATALTSDAVNLPISHVAMAPNGRFILNSSLDGKLRLWDYMNNRVVKTYAGPRGGPVCLRYNSGAALVAEPPLVVSGSDRDGVLIWDLQLRQIVAQLQDGATILDVAVYKRLLLTAAMDGSVTVYQG